MTARTLIQAKANEIDLELHRLVYRLQSLAAETKSREIDEISRRLMGSRRCVRVHMHPDDIAETA